MRFKLPLGSEKTPSLHQSQKACVSPHDPESTPVSMAEHQSLHQPQNTSFHTDNRAVLSPCKIQNITSASVTRTMVPTPVAEHPSHRTPISTTSTGHPCLHLSQNAHLHNKHRAPLPPPVTERPSPQQAQGTLASNCHRMPISTTSTGHPCLHLSQNAHLHNKHREPLSPPVIEHPSPQQAQSTLVSTPTTEYMFCHIKERTPVLRHQSESTTAATPRESPSVPRTPQLPHQCY